MADDNRKSTDGNDDVDMGAVKSKSAREEIATQVKWKLEEELVHVQHKIQDEFRGHLETVKSDLKSQLLSDVQSLAERFTTDANSKLDVVKQAITRQINDEISKLESAFNTKCQNLEDNTKSETRQVFQNVKDQVGNELKTEFQQMIGNVRSELQAAVDGQQQASHVKIREIIVAELESKTRNTADQSESVVRAVVEANVQKMATGMKADFEAKVDEVKRHLAAEFHDKIESERAKVNEALKLYVDDLASEFRAKIESIKGARGGRSHTHDDDDLDESGADQRWAEFEARMEHRLHQAEVGFELGFSELRKTIKEKIRKADERWQDRSRGRMFKWFAFTVVVVLSCTVLSVFNSFTQRPTIGLPDISDADVEL